MPEVQHKDDERSQLRRLKGLRARGGAHATLAIVVPLISGTLLVLQAVLLANVLGRTVQGHAPLSAVWPMILGIACLIVLRAALGVLAEQAGQIGAERIKFSLRRELFGHLLDRRRALGLAPASGAVTAALVDQAEALDPFFARYIPAMVNAAILPLAFAAIVVPVDWLVGLLFLITAPLIPLFMALAGWGAQAATDRQAKALAALSAHFADRLRGLLTLKLFGQADAATVAVYDASEALRRRTNAVLRIAFLSSAILEFFAALGVAGVALYVGLTFLGFIPIHPGLTLTGGLFALIMAPEVYNPLRQLAAHYHDRAAARSALAEIEAQFACIDTLSAAAAEAPAPVAAGPAALDVRNLTIRTETGRAILEGLDLSLAPGSHLAIMGESGIGKSTLARAITRLLDHEGTIAIDGTPLAAIDESALRKRVAFITQRPRIFFGTIAENIGFAAPGAPPTAIRLAADRAHVSAFADMLPDGLDTRVGEGGEGLSGGQVQRIALARLFLTDPGLIVLDEPTAHLDPETEARVLDDIFAFAQGRTLIVLTHARAVAVRVDKVMTLAGGKLFPTAVRHEDSAAPSRGHQA
ncbi:thiol reductant ABC exporter subunit CydD [Pelagibacterium xiamenense]|uniref:thiol reductant ABC exporter subunit CydD n=1 Tax=Pelagibacterium xiamenense TaxID=2901140 RepID=UPI001E4E679D|nr:thiol reductant ABC exporter subunit CydD [Pelagibacterium xiamenense]MCD7060667.1 thiol reductant ABC exporter subunit CydD [Pelagibacterium xiamenense]